MKASVPLERANALRLLLEQGKLEECAVGARALATQLPDDPFGWNILAVALALSGRFADALAPAERAVALVPQDPEAHKLVADVLSKLGRAADAVTRYELALALAPAHLEVLQSLAGNLSEVGRNDDANAAWMRLLALRPDHVAALTSRGVVLQRLGRLDEAEASLRRALEVKPTTPRAHANLGVVLQARGRLDEAIGCYRRALELKPDYSQAAINLGVALNAASRPAEAELVLRETLARSESAAGSNALGISMQALGRLDDAQRSFERAIDLDPRLLEAHLNLGTLLIERRRPDEATAMLRRAIERSPELASLWVALAAALRRSSHFAEARTTLLRALELDPTSVDALRQLATVLGDLGEFEGSERAFRSLIERNPDDLDARSGLLFSLHRRELSPVVLRDEAQSYGRVASRKVRRAYASWACDPEPRRLRVGLVSGDLCEHVVSYFLQALLDNVRVSEDAIELHAFPTSAFEDATSARLRARCAGWTRLTGLDDESAARAIHDVGVHVLVDLSGHTAMNRLPVFAWRPAPVQATWLGYFGTTGVAEIDWILVDRPSVSPSLEACFTERALFLPDTRLCFTPPSAAPPVERRSGPFTFGCFQALDKINDGVLDVWARIFSAMPAARLRVQSRQLADPVVRDAFAARLRARAIPASLHGPTTRERYLAAHGVVDVLLDTFPYTGGTTTCEALWMGVPTLTLEGESLLSRQGVALLTAAGYPDWVARDRDEYVAKAIATAGDRHRLDDLRAGMRAKVAESPIYDGRRFAQSFAAAAWQMWRARG